jgi:hypothetical protein
MLHVFSKDALMADGTSVYSIYRAARKKRVVHTINHSIVKLFITLLSIKIMLGI